MGVTGVSVMVVAGLLWTQAQAPTPGGEPTPGGDAEVRAERAPPGAPSASPVAASVDFRNAMGKSFRLLEVELLLDGKPIGHWRAAEGAELPRTMPLWQGWLAPGHHRLSAFLVFAGRNRGVFTYLDSYKVRVESLQRFYVPEDRTVNLTVVADERPDPTAPLMRKPQVMVEGLVEPAPEEPEAGEGTREPGQATGRP